MSSRQTQSRKRPTKTPAKNERVCLLVLGMHRSGTSALTRVMSLLGADLPATLLSGSDANLASNAKGHWESEPIVRLNDEIFNSAGISWRSPEGMPKQWYQSVRFNQFRNQAQILLQREFGVSPLFALKDPRICKLVPFWLSVLEKADIRPAIVSMVRSPEEVADSLLKRNALDRPLGVLMWLRYVLGSERDSRTHTRVHLSFDGLLADWQRSVQTISDTFDIRWPSTSTERAEQINGFLSDSDRHHRKALDLNLRDDISSWATEACAIFNSWVENKETASDHATLDALAKRFGEAIQPLLAPLLVSYEKSATVQKLQVIRASQNGELERMRGQVTALDEQVFALAALKEKKLSELSSRFKGEIAELNLRETRVHDLLLHEKQQLLAVETKLSQSQRVNSTLLIIRGRFEAASEELAKLRAKHEGTQERLNQAERTLEDKKKEAAERIRDLKKRLALAQELANTREKTIIDLREDRATKISQRDKLQASVAAIREDRTLQVQQRENRIRELTRLVKRLEKLQASAAAIHEDRALRLEEREKQIRELTRSVKRLEKKIATLRQLEREREVGSQPATTFTPAQRPGPVKLLLRSLIPGIERQHLRKSIELVKNSGLFDASFYLERYQDLQGDPSDLMEHYVQHGGSEGRAPSAAFNGSKYLQRYPDVAAAGLNPLVHFLECGKEEGRTYIAAVIPKNLVAPDVGQEPEIADPLCDAEEVEFEGSDTTKIEIPVESVRNASVDPDCDTEFEELSAPDNAKEVGFEGPDTTKFVVSGVRASDALENPIYDNEIEELSVPAIELLEAGASLTQVDTFSALAFGASDWLRSSEMGDIDTLRAGDIAVAVENRSAGLHASNALKWFDALNGGSTADAEHDAKGAVRRTLYDDRLNIEDAWLSSDYTLRIRLSVNCADALVIRCCQQASDGSIALCTEQPLVASHPNILAIPLASRFTAMLLVLTDRKGGLIDSTLLPFPTLLRGGVHHGELIDHSRSSTGWAAHEAYASNILIAFADKSRNFAVGGVSVALGDANGTEPIFSKGFRQWLSRQFKVDVTATVEANGNNPALLVLAGQMRAAASSERNPCRRAGRTLLVGPNSIPSLNILLARDADLADASALRTIVVDDLTRRPLRAVDYPIIDCGKETLLQHAFEPALKPGLCEGGSATVVTISFSGGDVRDVRAPFPNAGDVFSTISGLMPVEDEPVSAIVTCRGDVEGLTRLLASLARQQSVSAIECLLIGNVPDAPDTVLLPFHADRPLTLVRTRIECDTTLDRIRSAVRQAKYDHILLIDDKKVLHDPRTLRVLGALCARDEIGTAGCQVVSETSKKNGLFEYSAYAGYVPLRKDRRPAVVTRPYADGLDLSSLYPVLANPIGCLMTRREFLPQGASDSEGTEVNHHHPGISFGRAIIAGGKLNVATSLLSISDFDDMPSATVEAPWLATTPTRFIALEEY